MKFIVHLNFDSKKGKRCMHGKIRSNEISYFTFPFLRCMHEETERRVDESTDRGK